MNPKFYTASLLIILSTVLVNAQVLVTTDIDYIADSVYNDNKDFLDIYMPEGKTDAPVIVYFHGGALLMGNKSWGKDIGYKLAESGIGLVSVNYRLSPDFQHSGLWWKSQKGLRCWPFRWSLPRCPSCN